MLILRRGYDKNSATVALVVLVIATVSGVVWRDYVSLAWADFDPLLIFCWIFMLALAAWRFSFRRDVPLAIVALIGGAVIETWGTRTRLWTYFTHETPPLFILPAWPMAALATERITRALEFTTSRVRLSNRVSAPIYAAIMIAFCTLLWTWTAMSRTNPLTLIAYALVVIVAISGCAYRHHVFQFAAGSMLGWLLEYWGTTRLCWTYWDQKTPPLTSVLSHGFATIAFAVAVSIGSSIARRAANHGLARARIRRADA